MSNILNDICVIAGKYKLANGEEKLRYQKIGSVIKTAKGPMLKIDSIPLVEGGWSGWAYLFEHNEQTEKFSKSANKVVQPSGFDDMESDIPF
jgi:hypothetical protein